MSVCRTKRVCSKSCPKGGDRFAFKVGRGYSTSAVMLANIGCKSVYSLTMSEWTPQDFQRKQLVRRHYNVEGAELDQAKRIELKVFVDGKQLIHMQAREPGMLAFVSRPDEQGFEVEVVEVKDAQYLDRAAIAGEPIEPLAEWQKDALGI